MAESNEVTATGDERRALGFSTFGLLGFFLLVGVLGSSSPLLMLLVDVLIGVLIFLMLPFLRQLRCLPEVFRLTQATYRGSEPERPLSSAERREIRQLMRSFEAIAHDK